MRYIRKYLRTGPGIFDLAIVVLTAPWFLIPGLEGTEILQLARVARLLRIVAVTPSAKLIAQRLGQVGVFAGAMLLFSSWAAYIAEHATNPEFATYGDALWWGIVTLTTVGYGDITPITQAGRIAGVFLMLTGVATLGIISGTLASFFRLEVGGGRCVGSACNEQRGRDRADRGARTALRPRSRDSVNRTEGAAQRGIARAGREHRRTRGPPAGSSRAPILRPCCQRSGRRAGASRRTVPLQA